MFSLIIISRYPLKTNVGYVHGAKPKLKTCEVAVYLVNGTFYINTFTDKIYIGVCVSCKQMKTENVWTVMIESLS